MKRRSRLSPIKGTYIGAWRIRVSPASVSVSRVIIAAITRPRECVIGGPHPPPSRRRVPGIRGRVGGVEIKFNGANRGVGGSRASRGINAGQTGTRARRSAVDVHTPLNNVIVSHPARVSLAYVETVPTLRHPTSTRRHPLALPEPFRSACHFTASRVARGGGNATGTRAEWLGDETANGARGKGGEWGGTGG